jgi:hypothetical protein
MKVVGTPCATAIRKSGVLTSRQSGLSDMSDTKISAFGGSVEDSQPCLARKTIAGGDCGQSLKPPEDRLGFGHSSLGSRGRVSV